jgi:hypothetical protein
MRSSGRTPWRRVRCARLAVEYLEDRSVPAAALFFDPVLGDLSILGTNQNDRFALAADIDGFIDVTHNGKPLQAIDPNTNQPVQPTVWNTDSIRASLDAGDDVLDLFGDRLEQVGAFDAFSPRIHVFGESGDDSLRVHAMPPRGDAEPPPAPIVLRFDGGDGLGDSFRLFGSGADEILDVASMNDFHDVTLSTNPAFVKTHALKTERLYFDMRGGDDIVDAEFDAVGVVAPSDLHFNFDLGSGHDVFGWGGALPAWLSVNAGLGDDILDANFDAVGIVTPSDLRFNLGSGDDVVDLVGAVAPTDNHWNVGVNLGAGDDVLSWSWAPADPGEQPGSLDMRLKVLGGAGDDVVDLVGVVSPTDSIWNVNIHLGAGADAAAVEVTTPDNLPPPQGTPTRMNVVLNGGSGKDEMEVRLHLPIGMISGRVRILGSQGNDELALFADGNTSAVRLLIDGGLGKDTAEKRGKVKVLSC